VRPLPSRSPPPSAIPPRPARGRARRRSRERVSLAGNPRHLPPPPLPLPLPPPPPPPLPRRRYLRTSHVRAHFPLPFPLFRSPLEGGRATAFAPAIRVCVRAYGYTGCRAQFARLRHGRLVKSGSSESNASPHPNRSHLRRSCIPISLAGVVYAREQVRAGIVGRVRARRSSRELVHAARCTNRPPRDFKRPSALPPPPPPPPLNDERVKIMVAGMAAVADSFLG